MSDPFKEYRNCFSSFPTQNNSKLPLLRTPWSSKRYTPYSRTPKTGRVSKIPTKNPSSTEQRNVVLRDITNCTTVNKAKVLVKATPNTTLRKGKELTEINEDILSVLGKTWRIYQCSPFYDFDYKKTGLQEYKKLLSDHLESAAAKGIAFEADHDFIDSTFRAEFDVLKDFSFYDSDCTGFKVKVFSKKNQNISKNANGDGAPILDVIFCYFGNEFEDNRKVDCFTSLPLCLVKGPVALTKGVFSWFEAQFDCRIIPVHFSPMDLSWYASLWAGIVPKGSKSALELCYNIPSSAKGLNRVIYSINARDAQKLWNCCHQDDSAIFTDNESACFMKALESHFYRHFRINLGALTLTRIGNPLVFIGCEGRIKISQASYVRHILQQITASILEKEALGRL